MEDLIPFIQKYTRQAFGPGGTESELFKLVFRGDPGLYNLDYLPVCCVIPFRDKLARGTIGEHGVDHIDNIIIIRAGVGAMSMVGSTDDDVTNPEDDLLAATKQLRSYWINDSRPWYEVGGVSEVNYLGTEWWSGYRGVKDATVLRFADMYIRIRRSKRR